MFVRAGCVGVVCGIYARCLRVSVQSAHFSTTEVAYRIALLLFHFASPLSRRLHQGGGIFFKVNLQKVKAKALSFTIPRP